VTSCGLVRRYRRFGEAYYLHLQSFSLLAPAMKMFLLNAGIYLQFHTVLQPRTPTSTSSHAWEPQIPYSTHRHSQDDTEINYGLPIPTTIVAMTHCTPVCSLREARTTISPWMETQFYLSECFACEATRRTSITLSTGDVHYKSHSEDKKKRPD
jgi:hypothetical protein